MSQPSSLGHLHMYYIYKQSQYPQKLQKLIFSDWEFKSMAILVRFSSFHWLLHHVFGSQANNPIRSGYIFCFKCRKYSKAVVCLEITIFWICCMRIIAELDMTAPWNERPGESFLPLTRRDIPLSFIMQVSNREWAGAGGWSIPTT